jgi:hypothetical protein
MQRGMKRGAIAVAAVLVSASATWAADVTPKGSFRFPMQGLAVDVGANARVQLWCQGLTLLGVFVPDDGTAECKTSSQKRQLPRGLVLRDGRCESDGKTLSFGFLVARKAWLYDAGRRVPAERVAFLLHRFEGAIADSRLTGSIVQVDVSHPGYAFPKKSVEVDQLPGDLGSFPDEAAWRSTLSQSLCLTTTEP